jgi:hypothetical protein
VLSEFFVLERSLQCSSWICPALLVDSQGSVPGSTRAWLFVGLGWGHRCSLGVCVFFWRMTRYAASWQDMSVYLPA